MDGRKWQPAPVFLPGKFHRQRSLVGYSPWGHRELDMTKELSMHTQTRTTIQLKELCSMLSGDLNRKEIQKRGDICICLVDSLCLQ